MRGSFYSRNWRGAFVYMAMFLFALTLNLRAQVTTSAISGMVKDNNGTPLPGVNIIAVHEPSGTKVGTYTRSDGRYNIAGMRVGGPYTITASMIGYREDKRSNVNLSLGEEKRIDFTLAEEAVEMEGSEIVAERNAIINDSRTGAATTVSDIQVKNLPTLQRDFNDFTKYTPQFAGNSAAGRNNRYNNISIDGAVSNDLFGLAASGTPGGQAGTTPISIDAVQEFQVNIAPFDVRLGNFTGGNINAITRSGSNKYEGSGYYTYRDENFIGKSLDGVKPTETKEAVTGFRVSGPIIKDQLFFFVNGEIARKDDPTNFGILGTGSSTDFPGTSPFLSVEKANEIKTFLEDTVGMNPGTFGMRTIPTNSNKFFVRLDYNINANHRLSVRHNYVNATQDLLRRETGTNSGSSSAGFRFSNSRYIFKNKTNSTVAQLNSTINQNIFNEATFGYQVIDDHRETPGSRFPYVLIRDATGTMGYVFGTENFSQNNSLKQTIIEFTNNLTYYMGEHTIVLGTHNEFFGFKNSFLPAINGRYEFNNFNDFRNAYLTYQDPTNFPMSQTQRYIRAYSLTFALDPNDPTYSKPDTMGRAFPIAKFNVQQYGFYVQDSYKVLPNLTVTAGVRFDVPIIPDKPTANDTFAYYFPGYRTDRVASGNILWSPRIGWNWDVFDNAETQIRGGMGVFSGRNPYVWISNQYSNTGADLGSFTINNTGKLNGFGFIDDPTDQLARHFDGSRFLDSAAIGATTINVMDKDFKNPQVARFNMAIDQKLPNDLIGTVELMASYNLHDAMFQDISLKGVQFYSPNDNRPVFATIGTRYNYSTNNTNASQTTQRVNNKFTNVVRLTNTKWGYQWNMTFQLQKQYSDGWYASAAYMYGRSYDVTSATSSIALSNFQFNPVKGDPNHPQSATSNYEQRHRIIISAAKDIEFVSKYKTTFSVFYLGRSGSPYSTTYSGDVNGDGQSSNDLIYVPKDKNDIALVPSSATDLRTTDQIWVELDEFISGDPALRKARGKIIDRNASMEPWNNRVDVQVNQELPIAENYGKFELTMNMINFLNWINEEWGQSVFIPNQNDSPIVFRGRDTNNKPVFSFTKRKDRFTTSNLGSRWQFNLGVRYTF